MAKEIIKKMKVVVPGGAATPAPPLGATLGQAGVNIGEFVNKFNEETQDKRGELVPTIITLYEDRSFDLEYKTPPAASLILKAIGQKSGSGNNITKKVGTITRAQLEEIANIKMPDINAKDLDGAVKIIEGSCRSMGVEVKG
jgi:large subunit ribosomal protein L11